MNPPRLLARPLLALAGSAALAMLAACGSRAVGTGVVLWGDTEGPYATGSVVAITRDSTLTGSYLVVGSGERTPREFAKGRIRAFPRRADAAAYAKELAPWLGTWAFSRKEDTPPLPVRELPNATAKVVYKLRRGQLIKVIGRGEQKEEVKPYQDWWWEVVTEDGYAGWCFGHLLKVFEAAGDPATELERLLAQDDVLERILTTTWRPDYFRTMVAKGRIDLGALREDVGLFPDPENRIFRLGLVKQTIEFPYQRMERLGTSTYAAVGSDLRITVLDAERISVTYRLGELQAGGLYAVFTEEVAEVITRERERRQGIFDGLASKGVTLSSSSYGTITLGEGMRFAWRGFERLVPTVIGAAARGSGTVDFPYHLGKELAGRFEGVITFSFDGEGAEVNFLYEAVGGGLRLTSLSRDSFVELDAVRVGIAPVVIFFSQAP